MKTFFKSIGLGFLGIFIILALLLLSFCAMALEPHHAGTWHDPDNPGWGVTIDFNSGPGEFVVFVWNHDALDQIWLISQELCTVEESGCAVSMLQPSGFWNAAAGGVDIGDAVGDIGIVPLGDHVIEYSWQLPGLARCAGLTSGGLIFNECVGTAELQRLTLPVPVPVSED